MGVQRHLRAAYERGRIDNADVLTAVSEVVSGAETLRTRLPAAQVHLLPGVGHLPMMEAPQATAETYGRFLGGLAGAAGPRPQASAAAWQ